MRSAIASYAELLRDRHFMGLVFIGAFGISSFFAYLANSSFVLINHYGLTPRQYSIAFAANAASFICMSQLTGLLAKRFGLVRMVRRAISLYVSVMGILLLLNLTGFTQLPVLLALLFAGFGFLGLVMPSSAVLALEAHGHIAGTASALMGTLQFGVGAVLMAVVGLYVDGTPRPMLVGIASAALATWLLSRQTLGRSTTASASA